MGRVGPGAIFEEVILVAKWDDDTKTKALAIAEAVSIAEASRKTGVPQGTIKYWRSSINRKSKSTNQPNQPVKKMKAIAEEAIEEAKAEVRDVVVDQVTRAAEQIIAIVTLSLEEIEKTIKQGPSDVEPRAAWLRALVGAMGQGVEKHQLLTGQPTSRQALEGQVTQRHEYDITHRIEQYADAYRQLARRSVLCGGDAGDNTGEPLDTA